MTSLTRHGIVCGCRALLLACGLVWGFFPSLALAETRMLYFGGGGERENELNIFDSSLKITASVATQKKWRAEYQIDTEHPSSIRVMDDLLTESGNSFVGSFTADALKKRLRTLRQEFKDIRKDDQVLLVFATHGNLSKDGRFTVAAADGDTEILDELKATIEEANRRGVRLAVIADNCYSGNLLLQLQEQLADGGSTCLVTSSSPDRISYTEPKILEAMETSANLESAYLSGRATLNAAPFQPMISSPAGLMAARDLDFIKQSLFGLEDIETVRADRLCTDPNSPTRRLRDIARKIGDKSRAQWFQFWKRSDLGITSRIEKLIRKQNADANAGGETPELIRAERELYARLYSHYATKFRKRPNPCRDFKL